MEFQFRLSLESREDSEAEIIQRNPKQIKIIMMREKAGRDLCAVFPIWVNHSKMFEVLRKEYEGWKYNGAGFVDRPAESETSPTVQWNSDTLQRLHGFVIPKEGLQHHYEEEIRNRLQRLFAIPR